MTYNIIDKIYKQTGTMIVDDGIEYPEMKQVVGYHVNVLPPLNDTTDKDGNLIVNPLKPYIVTPQAPVRMFSGRSDTVCLQFKSREQWLSMGIEKIEELVL